MTARKKTTPAKRAGKQLATDGSEHELGRTKPISVYLPPDLDAEARARAEQEGRTLSNFIKWAVVRALREPSAG